MQETLTESFRLSPLQQRLCQEQPTTTAFSWHSCCTVLLQGALDSARLQEALRRIVARHEILHTVFPRLSGLTLPMQVIVEDAHPLISIYDWRTLPENEQEAALQELLATMRAQPFDLAMGPLLRVALILCAPERALLFLDLPSLCADGQSWPLLINELSHYYAGDDWLADEPMQYADLAEWQYELLESPDTEAGRTYWREAQAQFPAATQTLYGNPLPQSLDQGILHSLVLNLSPALSISLNQVCKELGLERRTLMLACWAAVLARLTQQETLLVHAGYDGRTYAELAEAVGLLARSLPLVLDAKSEKRFADFAHMVEEASAQAAQWQEVFSWQLFADRQDHGHDLGFGYQVLPAPLRTASLCWTIEAIEVQLERFHLHLFCQEAERETRVTLQYRANAFDVSVIQRLLACWQGVLQQVVAAPAVRIGDLAVVTPEEKHLLLAEWNATDTVVYPEDVCIQDLLEKQVERTPDCIAVVCEDEQLTYQALSKCSNQVAHYLRERSAQVDSCVGLYLERSVAMIVCLLGVLKAGAAYVPLDPALPSERLAFLLQDSAVSLLVTRQTLPTTFSLTGTEVCLERDWQRIMAQAETRPRCPVTVDNLAYVLYTSGSTGRPKGVMVSHRGLLNYLCWATSAYNVEAGNGTLVHSPLTFDLTLTGLFPPLLVGRPLILLPAASTIEDLGNSLRQNCDLSLVKLTPAHLAVLQRLLAEEPFAGRSRAFIIGGEALLWEQLAFWRQHDPAMRLINEYGPTETVVGCCVYEARPEDEQVEGPVPIGRPIANTRLYVLDQSWRLLPIGIPGGLFIGGAGLARGYLQRPELTAERFVPDPFSTLPGARLYWTGDLARYLPDGQLLFLGRLDEQVKIRGYRIELSEIEATLCRHPDVAASVVVTTTAGPTSDQRLAAYVVSKAAPDASSSLTPETLRTYLQEQLPEYMVPAYIMPLPTLPLTPNGKIDRKALPAPESDRGLTNTTFAPPQTAQEETLATIWAQVLGRERIGIHENFFALGGDSILCIQVIMRAKRVGLHFTARQLFQYQTIAQLSEHVRTDQVFKAEQGLIVGEVPLTPIQHWFCELDLPERHHYNQAVFLEIQGNHRLAWLPQALKQLLQQHDMLRSRFVQEGAGWRQYNEGLPRAVPLLVIDLTGLEVAAHERTMEALAAAAQASLDLSSGVLLRCLYFLADAQDYLCCCIHHLAVDGVSWRILLADLEATLLAASQGEPFQLPEKTTSFQTWARSLQDYAQSPELVAQSAYWLDPRRSQVAALPRDFPQGANTVESSDSITVELSASLTAALLHEAPAAYHTQINDILLAALALTFAAWTGQRLLLVDLEGHGREEIREGLDLSRTVGWFTTLFPVLLDIKQTTAPGEVLKAVKEQLREVPERGIGYGLLRYMSADPTLRTALAQLPPAQVSFNYLGQFDPLLAEFTHLRPAPLSCGPAQSRSGQRSHLLILNGSVIEGQLRFSWQYSRQVHRAATIQRVAQHFLTTLEELITHCSTPGVGGYTPSDFPLAHLDQRTLDKLAQQVEGQIEDLYPLSPMQAGMLFHSLYTPEAESYFGQFGWFIRGELNSEAWRRSWQKVVDRHTILRTLFLWQELQQPFQVVCREAELPWTYLDWRHLPPQEQQAALDTVRLEDRQLGFDLAKAPLLRLTLVRLDEQTYYFMHSQHHLLLDGWSQPLVFQEVLTCYRAYCRGEEPVLSFPQPYWGYIAWLQQQQMQESEQFWRTYLAGFTSPTRLAVDRAPAFGRRQVSRNITMQRLSLAPEVTRLLQSYAQELHITMNTLLQGCWSLLLARYSGEDDVVFGTTVAGRPAEVSGIEAMIGLFINTLPVRVKVEKTARLTDWLLHLQQQQTEARHYEYTPLVEIQRWSELTGEQALFETLFLFQNYPFELEPRAAQTAEDEDELDIRAEHAIERTNYPLVLGAAAREHLILQLTYDADRFADSTVQHFLQHLRLLLEAMASNWQMSVADLPALTAEEAALLEQWNVTSTDLPGLSSELCLHHLFEQQVTQVPDAVALVLGDEHLTYEALHLHATRLARYLHHLGVQPGSLVGVCLERSVELIIAILAVLKAGAGYVPLDHASPPERLESILRDLRLPILLTRQRLCAPFLQMETTVTLLSLDTDWLQIGQESALPLPVIVSPAQPAYVIYTSGSTGTPKGVVVSHANVVHSTLARMAYYQEPIKRFLLVSPLFFDSAVAGLYWTLSQGKTLVLPPENYQHDLSLVPLLIEQQAVSHILCIPSLYAVLLDSASLLTTLKTVIVAGETCPVPLVQLHRAALPQAAFYNEYGPSEGTVWCTVYRDNPEQPLGQVPIGRPIANTRIYLLDREGRQVPPGVPGEIYLGGPGVAAGYLNHADLTGEKFIPHPYSDQPGARLYRTGDLGRYDADGTLFFLGRGDNQVKLRGYRIELGEIEAALRNHPLLADGVLVLREDRVNEPYLAAYVVPRVQPAPSISELRAGLQALLPAYMLPTAFVCLERLPLTANGKVDRRQLPQPEITAEHGDMILNAGPIEEMLLILWRTLLAVPDLSLQDNFFAVGGHSLLAMQLTARIRAMFGIEVSLRRFFEAPTVAALAAIVTDELRGGQGIETAPLVPRSPAHAEMLPLSFAQQRLWFLDQLEPESIVYLLSSAWELDGTLNREAIEQSFAEVIRRHESLRTTFKLHDEQPVQIVHAAHHYSLPVIDLQRLEPEARKFAARSLFQQERQQPYNLVQGPLLRVRMLQLDAEKHILIFTMHHIISDGWSNEIFLRELTTLYQAFSTGNSSPLSPLPIQYADYALWQRQWLQGDILESQMVYWKQQLAGVAPLDFPTDHLRPPVKTFRGASQMIHLPVPLQEGLFALSKQENVTLFMLLLAAFQVLLARYTGQSDISVGTPIANRTRPELDELIGFFVNTLVLRTRFSQTFTFLEVLEQVREVALGAYAHQDVPFEYLVEALQPERDLSRSPLFQVMFSLQQVPTTTEEPEGVALHGFGSEQTVTKFDFTLHVVAGSGNMRCGIEYNTDLFDDSTIHRLLEHWKILLEGIIAGPTQRVVDLPLLAPEEQRLLLQEWNNTTASYTFASCLHARFEAQVECTPDVVALIFEDEQLTYHVLNQRANHLASYLRISGVRQENSVGICLERSLEMVIAVFAVLKAGGVYVPLDPTAPAERLVLMMQNARLVLVLTQQHLAAQLPDGIVETFPLDTNWQRIARVSGENLQLAVYPDNAAYILYTSGSTGLPKGVVVEHRHIMNYIEAICQATALTAPASYAMVQPLSVDSCLTMLFPSLLTGATLHIISRERALDQNALIAYFTRYPIDYLKIAPSHLAGLLTDVQPAHILPRKRLIIGGEASSWEWVQNVSANLPEGAMYNHYGPTETTVGSLLYPVKQASHVYGAATPIGKPLANTQIYILDRYFHPVPPGVSGELYIGGAGVARGYLGRPDITAERFIPHPWSVEAGARLYATGDLVRYQQDGNVEFIGRNDDQVKIRGYRVELGEIEAALLQHPVLRDAVVLARESQQGRKFLVAYLVAQNDELPSSQQLQQFLHAKLPEYMVPSAFLWLPELPHTPHGKIDRQALPAAIELETAAVEELAAPRDAFEEIVLNIWKQILGLEQVGMNDNFFALGGHSLLAIQLIARLRVTLQVEVPLRSLFEAPTIAAFTREVSQVLRGPQQAESPALLAIAPDQRPAELPLSFAQQRLWFLCQLDPRSPAYLIPNRQYLQGELNIAALLSSLRSLVQRHESLRTTFRESRRKNHYVQIGQPVQVVHSTGNCSLPLIDLSGLASTTRKHVAGQLTAQETQQPCSLEHGPLLRVWLVRLEVQDHLLLWTQHHIISDGWSTAIFERELTQLYQAFVAGQPSPLPPLPIQYADYALWQRQWLQGDLLEAQLDYWKHALAGTSALELPLDHPRPVQQLHEGAMHQVRIPFALSQSLLTLSQQHNVTLFMTLLAAFQVLLARWSRQTDIVVGTDSANRTHVELEGLIGFFVNLLALRTDLSDQPTFRQVLQRVRQTVLSAYSHQETPFELIVERLVPRTGWDRMPLVQVLFVLDHLPSQGQPADVAPSASEATGSVSSNSHDRRTTAKFDLALFLQEQDGLISGQWIYDVALFDPSTIATISQRFQSLLEQIIAQVDIPITLLTWSLPADRQKQDKQQTFLRQTLLQQRAERFVWPPEPEKS